MTQSASGETNLPDNSSDLPSAHEVRKSREMQQPQHRICELRINENNLAMPRTENVRCPNHKHRGKSEIQFDKIMQAWATS